MDKKPKETIYSLKGCGACAEYKKRMKEAISKGEIKVIDCVTTEDDRELDECTIIVERADFDGFPFVIDEKGKKIDVEL